MGCLFVEIIFNFVLIQFIMDPKNYPRVYKMSVATVYPHYLSKAEKKGRTQQEVNEIIFWLTGYDEVSFREILDNQTDFERFFLEAPQFNPKASKITGVICGDRVEEIEDEIIQKVRYLDKLIDELAKGKSMDKILRN
jgi:hypothetical protein